MVEHAKKKRICDGSKYSKPEILKLKAIFDYHDLDKNGKVTIAELVKALNDDKNMDHTELSLFRTLDLNHDGVLTLDEYMRRLYPLATDKEFAIIMSWCFPPKKAAAQDKTFTPSPEQLEEIKGMFNYYDKDKNGFISLQELVAVAERCGYDTNDIDELFATTDKDKDGKISFDEFVGLMQTSYM